MSSTRTVNTAAAGWLPEELEFSQGAPGMLSALFEGNPDMVIVADVAGKIVAANPSAITGFGYSRDELEGQSTGMLLPQAVRKRHEGHVRQFQQHRSIRAAGSGMELKLAMPKAKSFRWM
jgi:PAS domain S-box-containing protein